MPHQATRDEAPRVTHDCDRPPVGREQARVVARPVFRARSAVVSAEEAALWRRYRTADDIEARNRLVELHFALVHKVARRFDRSTGDPARYAELVSAGAEGLLQAVERFDPSRGYRLSTFAVTRIDGAIRDHLRREAAVPRSVGSIGRRVAEARTRVEHRLGRHALETEVARELGVVMAEYRAMTEWSAMAVVPVPPTLEAGDDRARRDLALWLRDAVAALPPVERNVISLAYFEDRPVREIAAALGVSESRISQIRTSALARLRRGTDAA